jgi:threonine/homoserine/homoserine lactone efflux protein
VVIGEERPVMGELLVNIAPLALGAAVNPGMTAAVLALLLSDTQPLERSIAYLLGAVFTCAVTGAAGLLVGSAVGPVRRTGVSPRWEPLLFLCIGLLLLVVAAWYMWRQRTPAPKPSMAAPRWLRGAKEHSRAFAFLMGAGLMLSNLKSLMLYVLALRYIVEAQLGWIQSALVAAVFVATMLLGIEVAIAIYAADRQKAARVLADVRQWLSANAHLLMTAVCLILGVYFMARGIAGLAR